MLMGPLGFETKVRIPKTYNGDKLAGSRRSIETFKTLPQQYIDSSYVMHDLYNRRYEQEYWIQKIQSPKHINIGSLYGMAFQYADKVLKAGTYTGSIDGQISDPNSVDRYSEAVSKGPDLLDFTVCVPAGYGSLEKVKIPNAE